MHITKSYCCQREKLEEKQIEGEREKRKLFLQIVGLLLILHGTYVPYSSLALSMSAKHSSLLFRQHFHIDTRLICKQLNKNTLSQELIWTRNCETHNITYVCINFVNPIKIFLSSLSGSLSEGDIKFVSSHCVHQ